MWPTTREQRCWVHKTANIMNKMPKSLHGKAKRALQEIWMAETKKDAVKALEAFVETYQIKYKRAADCLIKDRDALLAFYDFPAEHWKHLRTTNPIESTFATVRHRTIRSKGCLSNKTALAMIFKLVRSGANSSGRPPIARGSACRLQIVPRSDWPRCTSDLCYVPGHSDLPAVATFGKGRTLRNNGASGSGGVEPTR